MENLESYGEKIAAEMQARFKLTNEATDRMAKDIDKAIADGLKLDAWLRLPPEQRKTVKAEKEKKPKAPTAPRYYNKKKPAPVKKADEPHTNSEVAELAKLRKELWQILKYDFPGRTYAQVTQIKMNRLKELEFKFQNS